MVIADFNKPSTIRRFEPLPHPCQQFKSLSFMVLVDTENMLLLRFNQKL